MTTQENCLRRGGHDYRQTTLKRDGSRVMTCIYCGKRRVYPPKKGRQAHRLFKPSVECRVSIVKRVHIGGSLRRQPYYQVMFTMFSAQSKKPATQQLSFAQVTLNQTFTCKLDARKAAHTFMFKIGAKPIGWSGLPPQRI